MQAMSSQEIAPGGVETQQMRIHVPAGVSLYDCFPSHGT